MRDIICITSIKHLEGVYEKLLGYGEVVYEPDITKEELKILLNESSINYLFTNPNKQNFILDKEVLENSHIKVINTCSTGLNHIDLKYCEENDIEIWSLKEDYELINDLPSTAELAFGLMLSLVRKIPWGFDSVKSGHWNYEPFIGRQLKDLTMGIIGFGRLGKIMANYCEVFGMEIQIYDPKYGPAKYHEYQSYKFNFELNDLLSKVDIISLHVHVKDDTRKMINEKTILKMKKKPYIINTSRGEIVNEDDVIKALINEDISGYGTDVISDEFGNFDNSKLVDASKLSDMNLLITPHVGGMTWEGQTKAYTCAVRKFENI